MGTYSRLGKNTALVFLGSAGSKLMSLLMLPFYTRWLTVADYGSVDLITTYSGLLLGVVSCSIFDALFIFPKDKTFCEKCGYFSSGIAFWIAGGIVCALIVLGIKSVGETTDVRGFVYEYAWWIYGVLIVSYIQALVQQFIRSIDKMVVYSVTGIVQTASTIALSFLLIPKWGVEGYVFSIILANVTALIYSLLHSGTYRYFSLKAINMADLRAMLKYSVPLIPNGLMIFLVNSLNRPMLESYAGLASVGLFAIAGRFPNLLNTVYLLFQQAWLISVLEEAKKPGYETFYNRMLKLVVIMQTLLAVFLAFMGKWIIELFTTPDFYPAWQYIPLLVVGVIFMNVATFVGSNFAVTRESKYYFYSTVWSGAASLILNFALIPFIGIWGACWAIVLSQAVWMGMRIKYSWKMVHITGLKFYALNSIFLCAGIAVCILMQGMVWLYPAIALLLAYFVIINRKYINNATNLIKQYYGNRFNRA